MLFSSFDFLDHNRPILVFGRDGQVGRALQVILSDLELQAVYLGRSDCDISNGSFIAQVLNKYQPQIIINAAAYTAVDKAQDDSERELVFAINAQAPTLMANYVARVPNGIFVHYSTDYVFADTKKTPYFETDVPGPVDQLCVYGQSKLVGEQAIEEAFNVEHNSGRETYLDKSSRYFILRTSWIYGDGDNFIRAMLRLGVEREQLKVVADQVGAPTSAEWLAELSVKLLESRLESGIYHAVPDGEISWHALAVFAIETAAKNGEKIGLTSENIIPISAREYALQATRPNNSRLNNEKLKKAMPAIGYMGQYPHWQEQVKCYVKDFVKQSLKS
jgi:dTDP-4-dehydrorhamnose reductase